MKRDLIVTGIPRSGTTLTAALIDGLDDAVCLSEPAWQDAWPREMPTADEYVQRLVDDFARVRSDLLAGGKVVDRRRDDGAPVSDYFRPPDPDHGRPYAFVEFSRPGLSENFLLGMKQNAHYSCVLPQLAAQPAFAVIAIVRHPLDVIRSWQRVDIPIREGRLPAAERFWPEIAEIARTTDDILLRQVLVYERFCERFIELRGTITLMRYEDIVRDPLIVARTFGKEFARKAPMEIQPRPRPPSDDDRSILRYLKTHGPAARALYPDI
jgi:hypothetical protein